MSSIYPIFGFIAAIAFAIALFYIFENSTPKRLSSKKTTTTVIVALFLTSISACILAISVGYTTELMEQPQEGLEKFSQLGPYGDFIGGLLNPVFAFIGIIAASLAFYAQYRANQQVNEQFKTQQFESQFFEMLRLHRANIDEMKIVGYEMITTTTIENEKKPDERKTVTVSRQPRITEGRKVFVTMVTELTACIALMKLYCSSWGINPSEQAILELAYEFFFFGYRSEVVSSNLIDTSILENFRIELNRISDFHKNSAGEKNRFHGINGDPIKLYIKYTPFSGHENRLGHYYRHLYSTVKYVVTKEQEGIFDYQKAREYLKILRSQMSNDEQLMLYYNYLIGFGRDWENKGFLTKYRMLHNLPVNRVKYVTNPRTHFQHFIQSLGSEDGNMFEWGDVQQ